MFNGNQLIQLEYALKYVIHDLEENIHDTEDAKWLGDLCQLLATVQIEQRHASEASQAD